MVLELFDDDGTQYNVFFSSAIHGYAETSFTIYDDPALILTDFVSGQVTSIGNRFKIDYVQTDAKSIAVTMTVDDECKLEFTMIGQYDYSNTLNRYTMHYVRVNPPECYKCAICGMFGSFKDTKMATCDGERFKAVTLAGHERT